MKLAIVGSVRLEDNVEAANIIEAVLNRYKPTEVVSGGAKGIDTMAVAAAELKDIATKVFLPDGKGWYYYKKRNIEVAKYCDSLVRIYSNKSKTYGSGWTRDYARKLGKPTEEFVVEE
jgi:predicted Rossmann fold nucleotide-binding protein DprA/Smf involved in DNA uptake